jgi:isopropylmalate/homocitrate/citramalate synthase
MRRLSSSTVSSLSRSFSSSPSLSSLPKSVKIVEVGLRDGLQNEKSLITLDTKLTLLDKLYSAGLRTIEAGAFVSPKWVPQMKDTPEIFSYLKEHGKTKYPGASFSALTPNAKGFESALELGVQEVAIFGAVSETFTKKNTNCTIAESIERFKEIAVLAEKNKIRMRGYISCVLGCPYEGNTDPKMVREVSERLLELGCYEISLGDTIGVGNAGTTRRLLETVLSSPSIPREKLAVHFHDTYGQALSNILVALQFGISVVDSSVSGLGGCPYAKGASGNVATNDVVYMLEGLGIQSNVDQTKLLEASLYIDEQLKRNSESKVVKALKAKQQK